MKQLAAKRRRLYCKFRSTSDPMAAHCRKFLNEPLPPDTDPGHVIQGFREAVNMTPEEIEGWLQSDDSRAATAGGAGEEKEGRHMARRIVELLRKEEDCFYEGDLEHAYQVTRYIECHKGAVSEAAQGLEVAKLKNFGFDPTKAGAWADARM